MNENAIRLLHLYTIFPGEGFPPSPIWSPDGKWLALRVNDYDDDKAGIWVIKSDGSEEFYLGNFRDPVWSPDSHWLAYNSEYYSDYGSGIWISEIGKWKPTRIDLPEQATIMNWFDLSLISDWVGLINFTAGDSYFITEAGNNLNLRDSPSLDAEILHQLQTGDIITFIDGPHYDFEKTKYNWWKILINETEVVGWVVENHTWYHPTEQ